MMDWLIEFIVPTCALIVTVSVTAWIVMKVFNLG